MLLPSVAISIAINYLGTLISPTPTTGIVLVAVFLPSIALGVFLGARQKAEGRRQKAEGRE